jgi:hypothetical protein
VCWWRVCLRRKYLDSEECAVGGGAEVDLDVLQRFVGRVGGDGCD